MKKAIFRLSAILILTAMLVSVILPLTAIAAEKSVVIPSFPERPTTSPAQAGAYEAISTPGSDPTNWYGKPYGTWMAGQNALYFLSDMTYVDSSNTPNDDYLYGQFTTVDYPYATDSKTKFSFGEGDAAWETSKGIGMHPKKLTWDPKYSSYTKNRKDSWTIYDISAYTAAGSQTPADTFYALVGLTSEIQREYPHGVYAYIYGDKVGDGAHYELLAASELIKGYNLGEFNVNVAGVKLLLIDVILWDKAEKHDSSGIGFGNACLFLAEDGAEKPDYHYDYCSDGNHIYLNGFWETHSDKQHKMVCDCGEEAQYEDHRLDDGVDTVDPENELKGIKTYSCRYCDYQKTTTYDIVPDTSAQATKKPKPATTTESNEIELSIPGCELVTGGGALSIALMGLSAAWAVMKKKKSEDED